VVSVNPADAKEHRMFTLTSLPIDRFLPSRRLARVLSGMLVALASAGALALGGA
jgi:hypothetical protein